MGAAASVFPAYAEADWRRAVEAALKGADFETLTSRTADGLRIEPLYQPAEGSRALRAEGPWRIVARVDHPDPGEANAQALDDVANGADSLQVVSAGAIGAYGFGLKRFDSATLHKAFEGLRFDAAMHFELDLGPEGAARARGFAELIERSGARPADCAASFGLDPFAASAYRPFPGDWSTHTKPFVDAVVALRAAGFAGPLVVADARRVHAAGGTAAQELAFAVAAGVSLLRLLVGAGLSTDEARRLIAFRLTADSDQFVTLSKFRAFRVAWARVAEACGLEPRPARVHAESAWRTMTARDPYVNVMRGAIAAFSAGLGGADSVCVLPHTLAVGLPDSLARRLARNGQLILLRESNLGFVADPAAGAGAFEALTKALCEKSWALFQEIEGQGGLPSALANGAFQSAVALSAADLKRGAARLTTPITGVSVHADPAEARVEIAPGAHDRQSSALADGALAPIRLAEPFERLRDASDAMLRRTGSRPKVYLAALGPEPARSQSVAQAREWLDAGGFEAVYDGEAASAEDAVRSFRASGASLACLCGAGRAYSEKAAMLAKAIKASGAKAIALAGPPGDREATWRIAGVDDFIFAGGDVLAALQSFYRCLGISLGDEE